MTFWVPSLGGDPDPSNNRVTVSLTTGDTPRRMHTFGPQ
jgi:hypothetical protein